MGLPLSNSGDLRHRHGMYLDYLGWRMRELGRLFEEYIRLREEVEAARAGREVDRWGYRVKGPWWQWGACREQIEGQMALHERVDYEDCMGRLWTFIRNRDGARCYKRKPERDRGPLDKKGRIKRKEIQEMERDILEGGWA